MSKHSILHIQVKVAEQNGPKGLVNGLIAINQINELKLNEYLSRLVPDQIVDVFYDANKDDGTLTQLAKIHACIRQICIDTGNDFDTIKLEVKKRSGLIIYKEIDGDKYLIPKSFSKCSKEELNLAIQAMIEIGDLVGTNVR